MEQTLTVLRAYTGASDLKEALEDPKSARMLWLEILFNDSFDWEAKLKNPAVFSAYRKASVWYYNFRTMVNLAKKRKPLKKFDGAWDKREYRKFLEVLNFVSR